MRLSPSTGALVVGGLFFLLPSVLPGPARGQQPGATPAINLVISVRDEAARVSGTSLKVEVVAADLVTEVVLSDDGRPPDREAGDRAFGGDLRDPVSGDLRLVVKDEAGATLWSDTVQVTADMLPARVDVLLGTTGGSTTVGRLETPLEPATPAGAPEGLAGGPDPSQGGEGVAPVGVPMGETGARTALDLLVPGLVGLLLGAGLGAALATLFHPRRRAAARLSPVGGPPLTPPGWPPLLDRRQVWTAPDEDARIEALALVARRMAAVAPVLLVPSPARRQALADRLRGVGGVVWLASDRPEARELKAAAELLRTAGPPLVLIDGTEALEEALPKEPHDAVVAEVLSEAPPWMSILAVLPLDPPPAVPVQVALQRVEGGLAPAGGAALPG